MDQFSPVHFVNVKNEVASKSVFLSYASQDVDAARRICEALRAVGLEVWFDESELRGGDAWDASIRRQIQECALFIPLVSANTDARSEAYFRLEWKLAVDRSHLMADDRTFLLPVVIDATSEAAARVPDRFRERHWTRLPGGETSPAFTARVRGILDDDSSTAPAVPALRVAAERVYPIAPTETSLAVLPFANMSADVDNEHFCDGLAEELLNALSKIDALKVAARTSAFSFRGKAVDAGTIARTLGVTCLLDGSIRRSGNRLRISVQLVNAADGCQVWSERYDREMRDVFELQDEITLAVVAALKLKLFGEERAAVLKRYTDNAEAYELFLKGRHHAYKYTAQGWQRAIEFFEKAIALQPDYALALAGIAAARGCQWFFGLLPAEQVIPQCRADNARALSIDDGLADAYLSLGIVTFFYDWDWRGAERAFLRSIELKPNNGEALAYYALFLAFEGRVDEAMTAGRNALALDPLAPLINMHVGWACFTAGETAAASQQAAKMIEIDPDFYGAYWLQGAIHLSAGEYQAAADQLRTAESLGGHQVVVADLASACSLAGAVGEAAAILDRSLELRRKEYLPAICLARIYSRIGDTATAIEWLEAAFAERNGEMVFLDQEIAGAAADDPLRQLADEPRVRAMLDSMCLPRPG
jgi:serine/threonine-protein kinase